MDEQELTRRVQEHCDAQEAAWFGGRSWPPADTVDDFDPYAEPDDAEVC